MFIESEVGELSRKYVYYNVEKLKIMLFEFRIIENVKESDK